MTLATFTVMGDPVPMPRARVVRGKSGNVHAFTPEAATRAKVRIKAAAAFALVPYFVGPLRIQVDAYLDPEGITFWKRGSGDVDNFGKLPMDALEGLAYANDAHVTELAVRKLPATEGRPRLVITLEGDIGPRPAAKPKPVRSQMKLIAKPATYRRTP